MFQELHQKTVEMLTAKASNYLFEPFQCGDCSALLDSQQMISNRHIFNVFIDKEEQINHIDDDERIQSLTKCMSKLQTLHDQQKKCAEDLRSLRDTYSAVAEKTSSLYMACDQMMSQQTQLAAVHEQLNTNLYHYQQYDWIMKKLQTSKLSLTGTLFTQILSTIHECIEYLNSHSEEKEAQAYLQKYKLCLSKSLTAIKAGVLSDLEACREEVFYRQSRHSRYVSSSSVSMNSSGSAAASEERNPVSAYVNDDTFALYYGVFGVKANTVRNALAQAHHFFANTPEYEMVLSECEAEYFSIRERLLRPIVESTVQALTLRNANSSCNLTRDGCAFLLRLCDDEFRLYKNFFITGMDEKTANETCSRSDMQSTDIRTPMSSFSSEALRWRQPQQVSLPFDTFMEGLCTILYDTLRPLIISNPHLETLTQLCVLIKVEMIEERCSRLLPSNNTPGFMTGTSNVGAEFSMNPCAGFARVMGELVGDIVERIVYRASLFGQSDVLGYSPAPGDLSYPERLFMMNDIKVHHNETDTIPATATTTDSLSAANKKRRISTSQSLAIDLHCLWYPTVRRTVMCLSKLFKCLDPTVFLSVSSELLEACCQSLELAAEKIRTLPIDSAKASVKGAGRTLDAKLFVVKHLLILREQTSPYRNLATKQYRKQNARNNRGGRLSRSGSVTSLSSGGGLQSPAQPLPTELDGLQQQFNYSLDLSRYKSSMVELLSAENRGRWFELNSNNAVLSLLLSAPVQMSEFQTDGRRIIETYLRKHCHDLIYTVTRFLTGSLTNVVARIEEFQQTHTENNTSEAENPSGANNIRKRTLDLTDFEDLSPKMLNDAVSIAFKTVKLSWPMVREIFSLYIGSRETEEILLQPSRKAIAQLFSSVLAFTLTHFTHEQRQIASIPEQEQIWLLLNTNKATSSTSETTSVQSEKNENVSMS